jgi:hypothetical protein
LHLRRLTDNQIVRDFQRHAAAVADLRKSVNTNFPNRSVMVTLFRDCLVLSNDDAKRQNPLKFKAAVQALLVLHPTDATSLKLLHHRRMDIRGRTSLSCLSHLNLLRARSALSKEAPHSLGFVLFPN